MGGRILALFCNVLENLPQPETKQLGNVPAPFLISNDFQGLVWRNYYEVMVKTPISHKMCWNFLIYLNKFKFLGDSPPQIKNIYFPSYQ